VERSIVDRVLDEALAALGADPSMRRALTEGLQALRHNGGLEREREVRALYERLAIEAS
jgi:hypothetical protein